jgi:E3 ubiquitin-protein ligase HERC3
MLEAGDNVACVLLDDSTVKCWGSGIGDQLNEMGESLPLIRFNGARTSAISVGSENACALLENGDVQCWGQNVRGQLGQGDALDRGTIIAPKGAPVRVDLGTGRTAKMVSVGGSHSCAVLDNGRVKCWGLGSALGLESTENKGDQPGEMGDALPFVDLGSGRTVLSVSAGISHTCVVLDNFTAKCWGSNQSGQLGLGDTNARGAAPGQMGDALPAIDLGTDTVNKETKPLAVANISAGAGSTCIRSSGYKKKCWGDNQSGQLGLGDNQNRGDNPDEMGDRLPFIATTSMPVRFTLGFTHTCEIVTDQRANCWGSNAQGQLGLGDTNNRGDAPNEMGTNLPQVPHGTGHKNASLSAGGNFTCALFDNRTVKCWGDNRSGQLGLGDKINRGDKPDQMGDALPTLQAP